MHLLYRYELHWYELHQLLLLRLLLDAHHLHDWSLMYLLGLLDLLLSWCMKRELLRHKKLLLIILREVILVLDQGYLRASSGVSLEVLGKLSLWCLALVMVVAVH